MASQRQLRLGSQFEGPVPGLVLVDQEDRFGSRGYASEKGQQIDLTEKRLVKSLRLTN